MYWQLYYLKKNSVGKRLEYERDFEDGELDLINECNKILGDFNSFSDYYIMLKHSLIELKDERVSTNIIKQIESYLIWLKDYILPYYLNKNKKVNVYPIILSDGLFNAKQFVKDRLQITEKTITDNNWSIYNTQNIIFHSIKILHFKEDNSKLIIA